MNDNSARIEATIAALESQRKLLGDLVVDTALAPLRRELESCGATVGATRQQLKQVSVLFVDVVGSTAMGQQLQPEEIQALMDGALERFTAVVQAHRGRVLQYTGDGMLAAFGADESHEDDPECAVLAALGILEEARQHALRAQRAHRIGNFCVRTGVNTGTVLLGGGVDAEGSIRGAVVNVAARMEQSAPASGLRISHDTYRHVRGMFDVDEQPPILVKGIEAPVRNYLVLQAKPSTLRVSLRGVDGVETRLVGRDVELSRLRLAFDAVVAEGRMRAVTIVGDAGLGKSRLLQEFRALIGDGPGDCRILLGRSHPRSGLQPQGLLRDLIARELQIAETDTADDASRKLIEGMLALFPEDGEATAHLLGQLIGLDFASSPHVTSLLGDAAQLREQGFQAMSRYVRGLAASAGAPVVMVLDDLHWADFGSLDCVQTLLRESRDTPLLLLLLTRPGLLEQRGDWSLDDPLHTRIDLAPLDKIHSDQLAEMLLQRISEIPAALRALITRGAEGNPFYMEELIQLLMDDGVIVANASSWRVLPERLLRVRVPPTLTGVLQVRLDALRRIERSALQQAAVIGQVFSEQALAALDTASIAALPALLEKRLIVQHDVPAIDGAPEYAFQHNLLYQVTYDSLLKEAKRSGHEKAGAYWSARAEVSSPQEVTPAARRSLLEAHYHRCLSDPGSYTLWFDAQFSNYLKAYASETLRPLAEQLVDVCLNHFGPADPKTAVALTNLARSLVQLGQTAQAEPLLRRAIAIQEVDPGLDHPATARTIAVLGGYFVGRGDHRAAEPLFRQALDIRERKLGAEHPLTVAALDLLAASLGELGKNAEAELLSRRVLEIRERLFGPDHPATCQALSALGDILSKKKDHAAAEPVIRRALDSQRKHLPLEHPDTALTMWNLAEALRGLDRPADAEMLARGSLQVWEKTLGPNHEWTAWSLSSLAKLRLTQGDCADAAGLAQRAIDIHQRALGSDHLLVAENLEILARALMNLGQASDAIPLLVRASAIQTAKLGATDPATKGTRALLRRAKVSVARIATTRASTP